MPGTCEGEGEGVTWKLILAQSILGEFKVMKVSCLRG